MRCDDMGQIYIDGVQVGDTTNRNEVWLDNVATVPVIVAVRCQNQEGTGGLMVSVEDALKSDGTWKCTDAASPPSSWVEAAFDDSAWTSAHEIAPNNGSIWALDGNFDQDVKWLWTDSQNTDLETIYCRGVIGRRAILFNFKAELCCTWTPIPPLPALYCKVANILSMSWANCLTYISFSVK